MEAREPRERLRRAVVAAYGAAPADLQGGIEFEDVPGVAVEGRRSDRRSDRRQRRAAGAATEMPVTMAARVAIIVLVVALVVVVVLMARTMGPEPVAVPLPSPEPAADEPSTDAGDDSDGSAAAVVVVHVAGAVVEPGVVTVPEGTRVADVIEAAGGAVPDADLDAVNLAAPVEDGQQVYLPHEGEAARPAPGTGAAEGSEPLVDLNSADAPTLEQLTGIGPALASEIVAWRTEHGPFESVEDLLQVSGIGPATLERLRDEAVL
ncbi:helix-hairpin-helix domain-containing protein [Ruania rhizosphaerae]|uniref:helix-hairpin-helix domain-containing protein n=1 Tax=Ruania rhizosphaerae TaxID=1840413 RepID=UPI001358F3D2|nr:helix-hairpin-helix domain-containing protein [Ruania rhizosphaerae]